MNELTGLQQFPKQNGLFIGDVYHMRNAPSEHGFIYPMYMFWMNLDDLENTAYRQAHLKINRFIKPFTYQRKHYIDQGVSGHKDQIIEFIRNENRDIDSIESIYLLGQISSFRFYFSPVNFYFVKSNNELTLMIAEVSNTPWNEKHYYLIDLKQTVSTKKSFHVSPFMNLEMDYVWHIDLSEDSVNISIENWREEKIFEAGFQFDFLPLNQTNLKKTFNRWPIIGLSMMKSIYWQALKLFIKKIPFHSHPRGSYGKHT